MEHIKQFVVNPLPGRILLELHVAEILSGQIVLPLDTGFVVIVYVGGLICVAKSDSSEASRKIAHCNGELTCRSSHLRLTGTQ